MRNSWRQMLRPEPKSMALMKDLVENFSGDFVLDAFAGTLSTDKASLFPEKCRRFVKCEKGIACVKNLIAGLMRAYACQLLNHKSDLK